MPDLSPALMQIVQRVMDGGGSGMPDLSAMMRANSGSGGRGVEPDDY
jgi:hypothetical protein